MHGSQEEKYRQSFDMLDINRRGKINEEEFRHNILASCAMFSTMLHSKSKLHFKININSCLVEPDEALMEQIYHSLDRNNKGHFEFDEYSFQ